MFPIYTHVYTVQRTWAVFCKKRSTVRWKLFNTSPLGMTS